MQHRSGKTIVVANALSMRWNLMVVSNALVGFEEMQVEYSIHPYFDNIIVTMSGKDPTNLHSFEHFLLVYGFSFQGYQLCIPLGSR